MASQARKRRKRRPRGGRPAAGPAARQRPESERSGVAEQRVARRPSGRRGRGREAPPAPWGAFPLVELVVLVALVLLVSGFFVSGTKGVTLIGAGIALASLAGLELSIREHFSGHKSHTTVLAGAVTVLVLGIGFYAIGWPSGVALLVAGLVFAAAFYAFREAFKRRSGGYGFRA
jgi:hypothetical protein